MAKRHAPRLASAPSSNRLLASLPAVVRNPLTADLEHVDLPFKTTLIRPDTAVQHAWFVDSGVASVLSFGDDGHAVEVGTVGTEGVVGAFGAFGVRTIPNEVVIQVAGKGRRIAISKLRGHIEAHRLLADAIAKYLHAYSILVAQSAACNALHELPQRCARWLLMTQDRVGDELPLSQEFLSMMLGVTRPSVSVAAHTLQAAGLIRYQQGHITVTDRAGLETAACPCYAISRAAFEQLYSA
jgi:CRP-like cAMP-binding protein